MLQPNTRMIHERTLESLEYGKIIGHLATYCLSEPGRDLVNAIRPRENAAQAEHDFVLFEESRLWASHPSPSSFTLAPFPDISDLLDAVRKKRTGDGLARGFYLDMDSLWAVRELLRLSQSAVESLNIQAGENQWPHLLQKAMEYPLPASLLAALNRCVSDDGQLKDGSSPELFRLRGELRSLHQGCMRRVREYAQKYNMLPYLQDEFMTLSSDRYVLPLRANFKGRMQGIIHDWSQTGETCYFEPYFLVEINNRLQELKHEEREEERRILEYLTGLMEAELDGVENAARLLALLDMLQTLRRWASELDCRSISFTDAASGVELLQARHPLLALNRDKHGKASVIPLDIVLRPGERALIITGGNAGGKTVCLKTLGLLSALAMAGIPIPCRQGSHLPWFNRIDAFIGDEQSIAENVSTFSAQIDHLSKAFRHLDSRGLALLDEFGAGTDPAEGAALAQATHDELLDKHCFVLSATHFPALKSYALTRDGARAASMLFDPATNRPLFRLAYDQVGASRALDVAKTHNLPEAILTRARHYLLQDGADTSAVLERLNALAARREEELADLRQKEAKLTAQLEEKRAKLDKERQRLQEEIGARITQLMHAWKTDKATAKQTLKEMSGLRAELGLPAREAQSVLPSPEQYQTGQTVFHAGFNKRGIITDVDRRKHRARVEMDGVSLWADLKDLRDVSAPTRGETVSCTKTPHSGPVMTLDVRGQRAAEALAEVERFLDRAILAGSGEVEIVHGRGTGALRREIHSFLRSFPSVASLTLAPEDRGGDGMTIVALK